MFRNPFAVPSRQVGAAALLIAAVIVLTTGVSQWQNYHRTEAQVGRDTRNIARLLAEHAGQTFRGIEETLRAVGRLRRDVARGIYRSQASIFVNLNTLRSGSPALVEVGWFDAYGDHLATSRGLDPAPTNAAGEEFFRVPREQPLPGVYVATPTPSAEAGRDWDVGVSLRLENLDGSFAGIASGRLDPTAFVELFASLELGDGYAITLLRSDGVVIANSPGAPVGPGDRWVGPESIAARLAAGDRGTYDAPARRGRLASFAAVPGSGGRLLMDAGVTRWAAFAEFRRDFAAAIVETALGLTLLLLGAHLIVGGLRRREELQAALAETSEQARLARVDAEAANHAKSAFLARMSHELRTPLNAVLGFGQMMDLDRSNPLSARQREYCGYILQSGRHLLDLINEVLDFASVEAGRLTLSPQRIAAADAMASVATIMLPVAANAGVDLRVLDATGVPDLQADELRLRQVLINLAANAVKYNHRGGRITMSAAAAADDRVRLAVADTGRGIPVDRLTGLFRPFDRLGAERTTVEGTGLGLALSKRLVEAMGGSIGVSSEAGRGSTFWIELPAATPRRRIDSEPDAAAQAIG